MKTINGNESQKPILRVLEMFYELQTNTSSDRTVTKVCPRCGRDAMAATPLHNALSRHAKVYICDACGTDEAVRDYAHTPLPLEEWACAVLAQAKDFPTVSGDGTCNNAKSKV